MSTYVPLHTCAGVCRGIFAILPFSFVKEESCLPKLFGPSYFLLRLCEDSAHRTSSKTFSSPLFFCTGTYYVGGRSFHLSTNWAKQKGFSISGVDITPLVHLHTFLSAFKTLLLKPVFKRKVFLFYYLTLCLSKN